MQREGISKSHSIVVRGGLQNQKLGFITWLSTLTCGVVLAVWPFYTQSLFVNWIVGLCKD